MDRLISEQKVLNELEVLYLGDLTNRQKIIDRIKAIPSAEYEENSCERCLYTEEIDGSHCYECVKGGSKFEPKRGHWVVDLQTATEDYYICSECGRRIHLRYPDIIDNYPYCHCGARMFEPQEISDHNLKMWKEIYAEEKRREGSDKE